MGLYGACALAAFAVFVQALRVGGAYATRQSLKVLGYVGAGFTASFGLFALLLAALTTVPQWGFPEAGHIDAAALILIGSVAAFTTSFPFRDWYYEQVAQPKLDITAFNALATAVSTDEVLQARLAVLDSPEPAPGSVAASVTDAEIAQFGAAMVQVRAAAPTGGAAPTTEQQAAMASAVQASGLALDRFNAIAQAVSTDERLQARLALADAQSGS